MEHVIASQSQVVEGPASLLLFLIMLGLRTWVGWCHAIPGVLSVRGYVCGFVFTAAESNVLQDSNGFFSRTWIWRPQGQMK